MTPEESTLVELAFRFAPTWKGEREVGRLYHRLRRYLDNTGEIPSARICRYNARRTRYDVMRRDLGRHKQKHGGRATFSFYSLDHPDCPRKELEARFESMRSSESSPADQCLESLMEQFQQILPELPKREGDILRRYFVDGDYLWDIGRDYRRSNTRISQIIHQALPLVRQRLSLLNQPAL